MPELRSGYRPPPVIKKQNLAVSSEKLKQKRQTDTAERNRGEKHQQKQRHWTRAATAAKQPKDCTELKHQKNASDLKDRAIHDKLVDAKHPKDSTEFKLKKKVEGSNDNVIGDTVAEVEQNKDCTQLKLQRKKENTLPLAAVIREPAENQTSDPKYCVIGHTLVDVKRVNDCTTLKQKNKKETKSPLLRVTRGSDRNKLGTVSPYQVRLEEKTFNTHIVEEACLELEDNREVMDEVSGGKGAEKVPGLDEEQSTAPLPERVSNIHLNWFPYCDLLLAKISSRQFLT